MEGEDFAYTSLDADPLAAPKSDIKTAPLIPRHTPTFKVRPRPRHRMMRLPKYGICAFTWLIILGVVYLSAHRTWLTKALRDNSLEVKWGKTYDHVELLDHPLTPDGHTQEVRPQDEAALMANLSPWHVDIDGDIDQGLDPETGMHPGAFVYLVHTLSEHGRGELVKSLESIQELLFPLTTDSDGNGIPYNVVLFVEDGKWFSSVRWRFPRFRVEIVVIDPKDWAVNIAPNTYPEVWEFPSKWPPPGQSLPEGAGFSVSYRQMSRYAAGYMVRHPALAKYQIVIKLDPDTKITGMWRHDPFYEMATHKKKLGYWVAMEHPGPGQEVPGVTEMMGHHFMEYLDGSGTTLQSPELAFHTLGGQADETFGSNETLVFRNLMAYGCFVAWEPAAFATQQHKEMFDYMDSTGGFFKYRWDEQFFYFMYAAISMDSSKDVEFMDYVSVRHPPESDARPIP